MRLIIGNVQSPANPLLRAVSLLVSVVLLVAAFFFGAVILAVGIGLVIVLAIVGAARVWWIRRKLAKAGVDPNQPHTVFMQTGFEAPPQEKAPGSRVIEGEFTDVSDDSSGRSG